MLEIAEIIEKMSLGQMSLDEFGILIDGRNFSLHDVQIVKGTVPVKKPTMRGGVYFTNLDNYKLTAAVTDSDILPMLSGKMLGPNTEFSEMKITAKRKPGNQKLVFITNLTNIIQTSNKIVLNMVILRAELKQN